MKLSVIIVNYKTNELTLQTVKSVIARSAVTTPEIVVIDNNSGEEDVQRLGEQLKALDVSIRMVANDVNLGFSKANNQGMALSEGDGIALLNSDTLLTNDALGNAVRFLDQNPDVGAVGCRLVTPDSKLDHGCKRGFPTPEASFYYFTGLYKWLKGPRYDAYKLSRLDEHAIHDVDVISGAFMVMPRKVLDEVGLLDERFFMYGEDIDLCYRIKQAGYRIVYNPELGTVIHYKGSSGKKRRMKTLWNFHHAMLLFYNKHYRNRYPFYVTVIVYVAVVAQFLLKVLMNVFK